MEHSDMEVESSEPAVGNKDESCPEAKSSLPVESPEKNASLPMESSPQIVSSAKTASSEAVQSNQETSSQAVKSDQANSSPAVASDQTAVSSDMPPPQVVPSSEEPSKAEPSQGTTSLPGSSSEAVAPKLTNGPAAKKQRLDYNSMSTGVYLDSTVVPILHLALVTLDRLRPADPVQYVIDFLLRHKAQYSKAKEQAAPSSSANQA